MASTVSLPSPPTVGREIARLVNEGDPVSIEGGRDLVTADHLALLIGMYRSTEDWGRRLNIIELTQDQSSRALSEIAADFLRAPIEPADERGELGKAIALGHFGQEFDHRVDDEFDRYIDYYNDRTLLRRKVNEALALMGVEMEVLAASAQPDSPAAPAVPLSGTPNERLLASMPMGSVPEFDRALADGANIDLVIEDGDYATCSALIFACMQRRYDMARSLVDRGADLNHRRWGPRPNARDMGQTAMWWAAGHGRLDMVEYFIDAGGHVDTPDSHGSTPLHQAASGGHLSVVDHLLDRGADPMATIYDGRTPFNLAATHGRTNVVQYFLELGHPPDQTGSAGYTALMLACEEGKIDMARSLIEAGAEIDKMHPGQGIYTGLHRWTPLVFCVRSGRLKITKFIIEAGADVNHVVATAGVGRNEGAPEERVIEYCCGRQADRLRQLLIEAGATP